MQQLRQLHTRRGRTHRGADRTGIQRTQPQQSASDNTRRLHGRGNAQAGGGGALRPRHHNVQRRRTGRLRVLPQMQDDSARHLHSAAALLLERNLQAHRRKRPQRHRLHLLLEQLHRPDHRHNQTHRGQGQRGPRHTRIQCSSDTSCRGLNQVLFNVFACFV